MTRRAPVATLVSAAVVLLASTITPATAGSPVDTRVDTRAGIVCEPDHDGHAPDHDGRGAGQARGGRRADHADYSPRELRRIDRQLHRALDGRRTTTARARRLTVQVPVHVHVIDGKHYRGPTRVQVNEQLAILNHAYASGQSPETSAATGFRFVLKTFHRVRNQRWLVATLRLDGEPDRAARNMRRSLHRAGRAALNMYFSKPRFDILGHSSVPWDVKRRLRLDGVTVHSETLPGGNVSGYNEGDTAVHEVGHWLGLFHTFEGGCSNRNDRVADTPAEHRPSYSCTDRDSCPGRAGADPIHNFMDYSYDSCMNMFTRGQVARMDKHWLAFRTHR